MNPEPKSFEETVNEMRRGARRRLISVVVVLLGSIIGAVAITERTGGLQCIVAPLWNKGVKVEGCP